MVIKQCEGYWKEVCTQARVSFSAIKKPNKKQKTDFLWAILNMPRLMCTVGVESCASKEPQDADYLKPSWLFYLIVNHSVEWITASHTAHHCANTSKFSFCSHSK